MEKSSDEGVIRMRASFLGVETPTIESRDLTFKPSLLKRARRRLEDVSFDGVHDGTMWYEVAGRSSLGDSSPLYRVVFDPKKKRYTCSCYDTNHGQTRARRMCSHVVAVIVWRNEKRGTSVERAEKTEIAEEASREGGGSCNETVDPDALMGVNPAVAEEEEGGEGSSELPATAIPSPSSLVKVGWPDPPPWLTEYRPHQWQAIEEVVRAFQSGVKVVFLDAPTGTGKTAIAEAVGRILNNKIVYTCSSKSLQDQVLQDFPYAKVLKGRNNYRPTHPDQPNLTCEDCDGTPGEDDCSFCEVMAECPYRVAKKDALMSKLAVLNTSYLLREANGPKEFSRQNQLLVLDECDVLESVLMGFVEFTFSKSQSKALKIEPPKKGVRYTTIASWLREDFIPKVGEYRDKTTSNATVAGRRERRRLNETIARARSVANQIEEDGWVRDNDAGPLVMKPISVAPFGHYLFDHASRVLCMSATIISAEQMATDLGLEDDEYEVVSVPMTFPVENRIINIAPIADNTYKNQAEAWEAMAVAIARISEIHVGERVLVHTVSYAFSSFLMRRLRGQLKHHGRSCFSYTQASDRDEALRRFRETPGAVLFAPSMDRGIDLKGDECRVQVVAKVPYPSLGDAQIKARSRGRGGEMWYAVQTIRKLVQMTGRAVRSKDDWAISYILDRQFTSNLSKKWKHLFPGWWKEALNRSFKTKELR